MIQTRLSCAFFATLGSVFFLGCGAADGPQVDSKGPTTGFYDLHVEATSDSCSPKRGTGHLGEYLVQIGADASGANIPLVTTAEAVPSRQDIPLAGSLIFDAKVPACPDAVGHVSLGPVTASVGMIVVPWKESWQGLAGCQAPTSGIAPASDCASERVLTFTWLRPCPAPDAGGVGAKCD
jgi:hypothetical protein